MSDSWILPLINLGGAVAVTALFLYYSSKREEKSDLLARDLVKRIELVEEAARTHNKDIANQFRDSVQGLHDDLKNIITDHIDVTRENVRAVSELRGAVDSVKLELARASGLHFPVQIDITSSQPKVPTKS